MSSFCVSLCLRLQLPLCLCSRSWQGSVQLGDLAVDERTQSFFQFIVVPLQLSVVLLLVRPDQGFVLAQGVLAPARQNSREDAERLGLFFLVTRWSVPRGAECVITS